ncbi:siderophore-iron reductase FhuF [Bosea sp. F3-2]|uniref:siderophore-iron reductase FhuF n=1 Tax=Bosea sp. F3-2 TaxID=2599640 RepID=UPI0011EDF080|nr:siderophore-iron reductase FhuF [Bosea sp. F3-2]QEL21324.1 siderophore-iron reductase FhuF [Bosea sp. F3-2]
MRPSELEGCFTGAFAYLGEAVRRDADEAGLAGSALLDGATLDALLLRFAERHPGGERRALVSMWSQWHFAAVVVPAVAAILLAGRALPVALSEARFALHEDGRTAAILLGPAVELAPAGNRGRFDALIEGHVAPLIRLLATHFPVSARLMWTNAAVRFAWAVQQCAERPEADREAIAEAEELLTTVLTPAGVRNPLHDTLRPSPLTAIAECQRRVCCLRYLLPGVVDCGSLCPLPPARRAQA